MVLGEPALVREAGPLVALAGDLARRALVRDVDDRQGVEVAGEADLAAAEALVRPAVDHALDVVDVGRARADVAAEGPRVQRVADVHHEKRARAQVGADQVGEAGLLVDVEVVHRVDAGEAGGGGEGLGSRQPPQLPEVEDLHAVRADAVRHDEGVVAVDPHVAVARARGVGGEEAEVDRRLRLGDVDERRAGRLDEQGVLPARLRVGPAPEVGGVAAAGLRVGQEAQQVDPLAGVGAGETGDTGRVAAGRLRLRRGGAARLLVLLVGLDEGMDRRAAGPRGQQQDSQNKHQKQKEPQLEPEPHRTHGVASLEPS